MRGRWTLLLSATLAIAQPAVAADFGLLDSGFARTKPDKTVSERIIARAQVALARKPAVTDVRVEGISSGRTSIAAQGQGAAVVPGTSLPMVPQATPPRSTEGRRDWPAALDLAMAWRLTGDRKYLDQAGRYVDTWATGYTISFNPIDESPLDSLILAYDLTEKNLPAPVRSRMDSWLRRMATGYIEAMETGKVQIPPTLENNWQSHRIKLATLSSFQIGDAGLIERAHRLFIKQIETNLRADGSNLDFETRDALHYVNFALEPMLVAALSARMHGKDWYSWRTKDGKSLRNSLDWLARFATGERTHIEFKNSVVPYDRQRATEGGAAYQNRPWVPTTSIGTYTLASLLDRRFEPVRQSLARKAEQPPTSWMLLFRLSR